MDWVTGLLVLGAVWLVWKFLKWVAKSERAQDDSPPPNWFVKGNATVSERHVVWAIRMAGDDGIGRGGIIDKLGVRGNTKAENSVSYQLAKLRKKRLFRRSVEYRGRKYYYLYLTKAKE